VSFRPIRIRSVWAKVLYVVVAVAIGFAFGPLMRLLHDPGVIGSLWDLVAIVVAARIFRGVDEPLDVPRPWWRMTSRPRLSSILGSLAAVFAALSLLALILVPVLGALPGSTTRVSVDAPSAIVGTIYLGIIAALYLNSAARLRRLPSVTVA
jgi:hypothetical protein